MNLIKSTSTFSFFTFISRILGYIRDFLIAITLGSGPLSDAFFVAFRIPNTFRRLFSEGTFNAAFVPSYSSELKKSKNKANTFANQIFNILLLGLLAVVILIEIFMPLFIKVIAPGFSVNSAKFDLAIILTRITFPFLFFISLASFFSAILNSHNKFGVAAAAPIILNIILIIILILDLGFGDQIVLQLSYGVSIAGFLQLFLLFIFVKKKFTPIISFKLNIDNKVKFFFKKLLPSIFSSGVTQINILIGTIIASFEVNAVSYLYYADRIYQINLAIAGIAIGTVLLPNLSKHLTTKNIGKINLIQDKSIELSFFLSLPAMLALVVASEQITSSLFGYGSFDKISVINSSKALYYFAFGLPAFALIKILSAFLFARQNTKTPFYFSLVSVIINILISVVYFNKIGFIIIPIATTISSWINVVLLYFYLSSRKYFVFNQNLIFSILKISCSSFLAIYSFYLILNNFSELFAYESSLKFIFMITSVLIVGIIYLFISLLTKAFKLTDIKLKY